jgi:hypothetical protein
MVEKDCLDWITFDNHPFWTVIISVIEVNSCGCGGGKEVSENAVTYFTCVGLWHLAWKKLKFKVI